MSGTRQPSCSLCCNKICWRSVAIAWRKQRKTQREKKSMSAGFRQIDADVETYDGVGQPHQFSAQACIWNVRTYVFQYKCADCVTGQRCAQQWGGGYQEDVVQRQTDQRGNNILWQVFFRWENNTFLVVCRNGRTSLKRWSSSRSFVIPTPLNIEAVTWRSTQHGYVFSLKAAALAANKKTWHMLSAKN